jgi:para-aminobenzoate synthetase component 1
MTWWLADGGDPAATAAAFLADHGLGLPTTGRGEATSSPHGALEICGAMIFVSAAAGAAMIGGAVGPPSPSPAVPDLAIVIYAHTSDHPAGENDRTATAGGAPQAESAQAESEQAGSVGPVWRMEPWLASWTAAEHAAAVRRTREAIARGDVYQVNVVGHASAEYVGDPWPALRRVLALPGARHAGILAGEGWAVASASPETLVRVEAGVVETRPIKGTRPATAAGRRELLVSAKERAEHIMIVDLERNDLARVARTGTVDVPDLFVVRRWCDLWQAESRVVARLADGVDLAGLLRAVCPGGSVTGAPKLAALEQIAALEPVGRGASMGALGWLDRDRLDLALTIRTVAADANRVHLWTGGGITWDSDPEAEVAEAAAKAAPLRAALASPLAGPSLAPRASIRGG